MAMKKWFALLLALLMLLSLGCASGNEPDRTPTANAPLTAGRYVESEPKLPLPDGMQEQMLIGVRQETDGLSVFASCGVGDESDFRCMYYRHTIASDGTVTTADEPWLNALAPQGGNELHVVSGEDGALYACFSDYDDNGKSRAHLLVSHDDGKTGAALTGNGLDKLDVITSFGVLADGRFAVSDFYSGAMLLLDAQGALVSELNSGDRGQIVCCAAGGSFVAFAVQGSDVVRVYNAATDAYSDYPYTFSEQSAPQLALTNDGTVYLADETGLYRRATGASLWEQLLDGATSTLGLPGFYATGLIATGAPYARLFLTGGMDTLLSFTYDQAATTVAERTINVFSLYADDTVRQAIVLFNRTRPDVKVSYTVAMEGASAGTEQDYIKALNTELLAGTGPDILLLDGLPIDSYIEKDVLADLTETVNGSEPMLQNIRAAFETQNGLFALPTGFCVPLAITRGANGSAYASLAALADAAEQTGDVPLLSKCAFNYEMLAYYLLTYYASALTSGDPESVEAFLTNALRLARATGCTNRLGESWDALKDISQAELYTTFRDYVAAIQIVTVLDGQAVDILCQPMRSVIDCMEPFAFAQQQGATMTNIAGQFVPVGIVGVNKASAEPEAARAFVTMLLSSGAQDAGAYASRFPVNEQALATMLSREIDGVGSGYQLIDGSEFFATYPTAVWRERLGETIRTLSTPLLTDAALKTLLMPELTGCLDGTRTPAEAAERIESLMKTYLAE